MIKLIILLLILPINVMAYDFVLPDNHTNGGINRKLTKEVICSDGFRTKDYRNVTKSMKNKVYKLYNTKPYVGVCAGLGCEVDHLIPIYIGGSNDISNLWIQPYSGEWSAYRKDHLEVVLHKLVCSGTISLEQAQREISTNWVESYKKHVQ